MDLDSSAAGSKMAFFTFQRAALTLARIGRIEIPGRTPIITPNFIPITSRGVVPHLTPDNFTSATVGVYTALEDCELLIFHQN
jgi:queuine tRNA-ribosyltransferase subunit QTRTD1